jgi:hypothetical protein
VVAAAMTEEMSDDEQRAIVPVIRSEDVPPALRPLLRLIAQLHELFPDSVIDIPESHEDDEQVPR